MKSVFVNTMEVNGVQMLGFLNHIDLHCMDYKNHSTEQIYTFLE